MRNVKIVSNVVDLRRQVQEDVNGFKEGTQISFLLKFIPLKFGCNCEYAAPKNKGDVKFIYCYFPAEMPEKA